MARLTEADFLHDFRVNARGAALGGGAKATCASARARSKQPPLPLYLEVADGVLLGEGVGLVERGLP